MSNHTDDSSNQRADADHWERDVLIELASAGLREHKRARRWGIFFKLLGFALVGFLIFVFGNFHLSFDQVTGKHTALVKLSGEIADHADASAKNVIAGLRDAFNADGTAGVILQINSPGGSPVQAGLINQAINQLRAQHPDIPLYAVITDICASGGLYAAVAADKIYANKASIVGSVGVRLGSFGFVDVMKKLGIERRLLTAGKHKALLDPFQPVDPAAKSNLQAMLNGVYQQFVKAVKQGRGDRLAEDKRIFSGLVWTGVKAKQLGLIDDLGSTRYVAKEVIGAADIKDYTHKENLFDAFSNRVGAAFEHALSERLFSPHLR